MPKVRRKGLPKAVLDHLLDRIHDRSIPANQLELLAQWLCLNPEVPDGPWFKRFPGMIACGEGELVKTFLLPSHIPHGKEL